jgi:putative ABC transport system ATP-binding protein
MVHLQDVDKIYRTRRGEVTALSGVNLTIQPGEFVVVCGPSGSGKSTLLLTIAGMQRPTRGKVLVHHKDLYAMDARRRARFRAENVGFVFQMFHLLPYLSVTENVLLAGRALDRLDRTQQAQHLLQKLGLAQRTFHKPPELSAGEKQRTAIARALLNHPRLILADEPTGNLDPDNAAVVLGYLADFHKKGGTVILATHSEHAGKLADRTVHLLNGHLVRSA